MEYAIALALDRRAERARREAAEVARNFGKVELKKRPTIAELEAILNAPDGPMVEILPNGEVGVKGTSLGDRIADAILSSPAPGGETL